MPPHTPSHDAAKRHCCGCHPSRSPHAPPPQRRPPTGSPRGLALLARTALLLALAAVAGCKEDDDAGKAYLQYATSKHFERFGPKYLDRESAPIPREAAMDVSPKGSACRRRAVIMTLANTMTMEKLLPYFMASLQRATHVLPNGRHTVLARHTVVAVNLAAHSYCKHLSSKYGHK